jgi:hypothetical protein
LCLLLMHFFDSIVLTNDLINIYGQMQTHFYIIIPRFKTFLAAFTQCGKGLSIVSLSDKSTTQRIFIFGEWF